MTEIRDAATLVLLRDRGSPFELLMLRRHHGHEFMANAWVFPGGRVEARDREEELGEHFGDFDVREAAHTLGGDVDAATARGLYAAAIRETFEEAGLLLGRRRGGGKLRMDAGKVRATFETLRRRLADGDIGLADLAREEEVVFDVGRLVYFAHWITPDFEPKRYDTRFFVARAPRAQQHSHDDEETTQSAWWTPDEAIGRYRGGEVILAPPTLRILEELSRFSVPEEAVRQLRRRPAPPAIMPHPVEIDGNRVVLALPGDPDYPGDTEDKPHDGVTRMERRDGQWYSIYPSGGSLVSE